MVIVVYSQKQERTIIIQESTPDAILLWCKFSTVIQNGHRYTAIKIIEKISNYLKRLI
jgi:hypothetical protein